ncbi:MAG: Holliday junction branch migration protein RuvA [Anaerolineae bacterium]|nr:Holliday junction branch migration protein RuvA [Anaerolineae bacterium]
MSLIDNVTGEVTRVDKDSVVINVGGIGLRALVPRSVQEVVNVGHMITIYTNLVLREDSITLYGFVSEEERALFNTLTLVNGVGPKMGIAILSTLSVEQLRSAVVREEAAILTRVPGVGKKTAEKIVFELKGKMGDTVLQGLTVVDDVDTEVLAALTSLGYSVVEAQTAIQSIPRDAPRDVESRVVMALQYFS